MGLGIFSYRANDRHVVYALDDSYIHMAVAKNLVQHRTCSSIRWGASSTGIMVAYESWFKGEIALPEEWTVAGTWTISHNVICGDSTVSFLAAEPSEVDSLLAHLRSFAPELPEGVVWKEHWADERDGSCRHVG